MTASKQLFIISTSKEVLRMPDIEKAMNEIMGYKNWGWFGMLDISSSQIETYVECNSIEDKLKSYGLTVQFLYATPSIKID